MGKVQELAERLADDLYEWATGYECDDAMRVSGASRVLDAGLREFVEGLPVEFSSPATQEMVDDLLVMMKTINAEIPSLVEKAEAHDALEREVARLREELTGEVSGRTENEAREALGAIMRLETGERPGASMGVVSSSKAYTALVHAYGVRNRLRRERDELLKEGDGLGQKARKRFDDLLGPAD